MAQQEQPSPQSNHNDEQVTQNGNRDPFDMLDHLSSPPPTNSVPCLESNQTISTSNGISDQQTNGNCHNNQNSSRMIATTPSSSNNTGYTSFTESYSSASSTSSMNLSTPSRPTSFDIHNPRRLVRDSPLVTTSVPTTRTMIGFVKPIWVPDEDASTCMMCDIKFTVIKRRHHCRACGKVLCSSCCYRRAPLYFMNNRLARVCNSCYPFLVPQSSGNDFKELSCGPSVIVNSPDPSNPLEYCSRIPPPVQSSLNSSPLQPPPSVLVPVGVLKKRDANNSSSAGQGSERRSDTPKQVVFADGIRPGWDLTEHHRRLTPANHTSPSLFGSFARNVVDDDTPPVNGAQSRRDSQNEDDINGIFSSNHC